MGCSNSKSSEERFKLTDIQRKAIQENAQSIVLTNAVLRVSATNCAARYRGNRTRENILNDTTPLADYFGNTPIPVELGNGEKSVADALTAVKKMAFENISGRLGPQIERQYPKIISDVELQKAARNAILAESDAAVMHTANELVEKCLFVAQHPPEADRVSTAAKTAVHEVHSDMHAPQNRVATRQVSEAHQGSRAAPATAAHHREHVAPPPEPEYEDAIVLPKGDWVKADGTPYYYSATENLYFHPPSGQFYDPSNEMWYDPDKDEWYSEKDDEAETY